MTNFSLRIVHQNTIRLLVGIALAVVAACSDGPKAVIAEPFESESTPGVRDDLMIFVGRKISVEEFEPEVDEFEPEVDEFEPEVDEFEPVVEEVYISMDRAFLARYEVLSILRGEYEGETIEFKAYDHFGLVEFANHETVVLFVSLADDGTYYHQKYQYLPVYPTADGSWAGCGDPYALEPSVHRRPVEARPIEFDPPLVSNLHGLTKAEIDEWYSPDYFRFKDSEAECVMGNSVEELLQVKFDGVLGARGFHDTQN